METIYALISGFSVALTLQNLMWGFIGVMLGTAVGVLPGVGPALTVALLLPATAQLDPTGALIMFAVSTTGRCSAAQPHRSFSTRQASPPRSSLRWKET